VREQELTSCRQVADRGCAVMLLAHAIDAALTLAADIAVFYAGTTVEIAPAKDFSGNGEALRHPYSKALWRALPQNDFIPIPGSHPHPDALPSGCLFAPRCPWATEACVDKRPEMRDLRGGTVRCIHAC